MFAYTHCTHLFKHIRKPQRKPHRHHLVSSRLTVVIPIRRGSVRGNFHCRLLPFNWLGDFSVLSRYPRVIVSIVACPLFTPFPHHSCSHNLAPSILTRSQMVLVMAPTFVSDKRHCSAYWYSSSSRARAGKKSGLWRFDINVVYKSEICEVCTDTSIYYAYCSASAIPPSLTLPKTLLISRYTLHYNWWYGYDIVFFFFLERKCVSDKGKISDRLHNQIVGTYFIENFFQKCGKMTEIKHNII